MTRIQFLSPHHDDPTVGFFVWHPWPRQRPVSWGVPPSPVELHEVVSRHIAEQFKVWIQEFNTHLLKSLTLTFGQATLSLFHPTVFEFECNLLTYINSVFLVHSSTTFDKCISTSSAYHPSRGIEPPNVPVPLYSQPSTPIPASGNQRSVYSPYSFAFSRTSNKWNQYVVFWVWRLSLNICICNASVLSFVEVVHSFLLPSIKDLNIAETIAATPPFTGTPCQTVDNTTY